MIRHNAMKKSLESVIKRREEESRSPPTKEDTPQERIRSGSSSGIGAVRDVSRAIESIRETSAQEINVSEIAGSAFSDRINAADEINDLMASIRDHGQKVPALLRPLKGRRQDTKRYEVVYGRRRIEACRMLGRAVIAHVTDMSDDEALLAQGLENSARLETSFIERALFAAQLEEAGQNRDLILSVLNVDRTTLSRMRKTVTLIPTEIIQAIGPARDLGRRPWSDLAKRMEVTDLSVSDILSAINMELDSAGRLRTLLLEFSKMESEKDTTSRGPLKASSSVTKKTIADGRIKMSRKRGTISINAPSSDKEASDFIVHIEENLHRIFEDWSRSR